VPLYCTFPNRILSAVYGVAELFFYQFKKIRFMKKFSILLVSVCSSVTLLANILKVSNRPESPAMFTELQAAVDAATNGDTILVTGSGTTYGGCNVSKKLCFQGQGYDPRKDVAFPTQLSTLNFEVGSDSSWV
jgi:hypothetical protein